jgi:hypothetical protein
VRARDGGGDATPDAGAWRCVSCNAINGGGDERCIGLVGGRRCNRLRATGIALVGAKRSRAGTQLLRVSGGACQSYESVSGASSSSGGPNPSPPPPAPPAPPSPPASPALAAIDGSSAGFGE